MMLQTKRGRAAFEKLFQAEFTVLCLNVLRETGRQIEFQPLFRELFLQGFQEGFQEGRLFGRIQAYQQFLRQPETPNDELSQLPRAELQRLADLLEQQLENRLRPNVAPDHIVTHQPSEK